MPHILDQDEIWIDKHGKPHKIAEMDGKYASNTYDFLKRHHKQLATQYIYNTLLRMRGPEGEMAAEAFESWVDEQTRKATERPFAWLLDKPLTKALARRVLQDRIAKGWANPYPEPMDPDYPDPRPTSTYQAQEFEVKPIPDFDEKVFGPQPGDERRIFIVTTGAYEDTAIKAVFVGDRRTAYQTANELDRYDPYAHSEVNEWDDTALKGSPAEVRTYRPAWTQVEYSTTVSLSSGKVITDKAPDTEVVVDRAPRIKYEREMVGGRGDYRVRLTTRGPDGSIDRIREMHTHLVNQAVAQVVADLTKGETQ